MKPTKPVHYHAHGNGGFRFDCYQRELQVWAKAHNALKDRLGRFPNRRESRDVDALSPLRHTSLERVTCRECWSEIYRIAVRRLTG